MKREDGQLRDVRVPMHMSKSEVDAIDDWRIERRVWSRSEAIRQLVQAGIKATASLSLDPDREG
jgi:metal-responsive CopG/Arc/MetJ family transcriptional regulator